METQQQKTTTKTATLIALAIISVGSIASASYLYIHNQELAQLAHQEHNGKEQALAEHRITLDELHQSGLLLDGASKDNLQAQASIADLERKLKETDARANDLARTAVRNEKQTKELNDLRTASQQLRDQLAAARATELDLRASVDRANAEREALAHQLEQQGTAARLVNNAELAALKGRKGKLTVKARRTNEVRMAFDLPEAMASGANFKITAPGGKQFSGADPAISMSRDNSDATASMGGIGKPGSASRTSRVDLKFKTKEKLEAGIYRIDISSGKNYLQTVFLNLR